MFVAQQVAIAAGRQHAVLILVVNVVYEPVIGTMNHLVQQSSVIGVDGFLVDQYEVLESF